MLFLTFFTEPHFHGSAASRLLNYSFSTRRGGVACKRRVMRHAAHPDNTPSLQTGFNCRGEWGASHSCNTTPISAVEWGRDARVEEERGIVEGVWGGGDCCAFSCSWTVQFRQVLWSLPSQQATTPNTKVLANGTPSE